MFKKQEKYCIIIKEKFLGDIFMNFIKNKNIIFYIIIIFLLCGIIGVSVVCANQSEKYKSLDAKIKQSESQLKKANESISDLNSIIEKEKENNSSLKSEIDKINQENNKLKNDNSKLKDENDSLEKANSSLKKNNVGMSLKKNNTAKKINAKQAGTKSKPSVKLKKSSLKASQSKVLSKQAKVPSKKKVCYLTFDDGPSENTISILKTLDKYNVKATFFVIGTTREDYIKKVYNHGHTIGLHSYTHDYSKIYKSTSAYFNDLKKISDKVKKCTGQRSMVVRFPGGSSNCVSKKYCYGIMSKLSKALPERGYAYFDWNVASGDADSVCPPKTRIINNVLNGAKGKTSICVLMHDASAKKTTAQALPQIIVGLKKMGYTFAPLDVNTYGFHHSIAN